MLEQLPLSNTGMSFLHCSCCTRHDDATENRTEEAEVLCLSMFRRKFSPKFEQNTMNFIIMYVLYLYFDIKLYFFFVLFFTIKHIRAQRALLGDASTSSPRKIPLISLNI